MLPDFSQRSIEEMPCGLVPRFGISQHGIPHLVVSREHMDRALEERAAEGSVCRQLDLDNRGSSLRDGLVDLAAFMRPAVSGFGSFSAAMSAACSCPWLTEPHDAVRGRCRPV